MKKTLSLFVAAIAFLPLIIQANSTGRAFYPDTVNYPWQRLAPPLPPMWNSGNIYRPRFVASRFQVPSGMAVPGFNRQPYPGYRYPFNAMYPPLRPYVYRPPPHPAPMVRWQGPQRGSVYPAFQHGMQNRPPPMNPYVYRMRPRPAPMARWRGPQRFAYNNGPSARRGMPPLAYAGRFTRPGYPYYRPGMQNGPPPMNPYAYRMRPRPAPVARWRRPQRFAYNNGPSARRGMSPLAYAGRFNRPGYPYYQPGMQNRPPPMNPYAYRMPPRPVPMARWQMPQRNTSYRPPMYRPAPPARFAYRSNARHSGYTGRWNAGRAYPNRNIVRYRYPGYPQKVTRYQGGARPVFNTSRYKYQQTAQAPYRPHVWQVPDNHRRRAKPVNRTAWPQPQMRNKRAYIQQANPVRNRYVRWDNQPRNTFPVRKTGFLN
ncbi:MAG TPA: hypothetical protein ENI65_07730 [Gammaproteobacteria bacterium]|nr:hypothetical protein [Gammaproteobacteria bacterium]